MKTSEIEIKLANEISNEVPDVLDSILSRCEATEQNVIEFSQLQSKPKNNAWIKSLCATAAALAVIVGGYLGIGQYQTAIAVESVITLDVNPSVRLEVNKNEKVISATGLNEDGIALLCEIEQDGEKLKSKSLEVAVNVLITAMVEDGYLSQTSNSILVTVNNSDEKKSAEIKAQLLISVDTALTEKGIEGAILGQSGAENEKITELAAQYGISEGKASFIEKIIIKAPGLSFDDLAGLNINDLSLLAKKWLGEIDKLTIIGTPNDNGVISAENAIESACSDVNITIGSSAEIGSIQLENGKLVYEVTVKAGNTLYDYVIDAKTGEVINWVSKLIEDESTATNQSGAAGSATRSQVNDWVSKLIEGESTATDQSGAAGSTPGSDQVSNTDNSGITANNGQNNNANNSADSITDAGKIIDSVFDTVTGIIGSSR